jgi:hypothetical protein
LDISLGLSIRTHSLVRANQNLPFKKVYVVSKRNVRLFFFKFQVTKILTELTLLA